MVILLALAACGHADRHSAPADETAVDTASERIPGDTDTGVDTDTGGDSETEPDSGETAPAVDRDGDMSPRGEDCDDDNPFVHPGATELCDAVDQDCDGDNLAPGVCGGTNYLTGMIIPISHITDLQWTLGIRIVDDLTGDGHPDVLGGPALESEVGDKLDAIWDGAKLPADAPDFPDGTAALIIDPEGYEDSYARLSPGDVDGDGAPDAAFFDSSYSAVYVFNGPIAQDHRVTFSEASYIWTTATATDGFVTPEAELGDINGDSRNEFSIMAGIDHGDEDEYWTEVFFGTDAPAGSTASLRWSNYSGNLVNVGDLTGDGAPDLLFESGTSSIIDGSTVMPGMTYEIPDLAIWESVDGASHSLNGLLSVGTTGDWDGDGYPEVYVAQDNERFSDGYGAVYFYEAPFDATSSSLEAVGIIIADSGMMHLGQAIWQISDTTSGRVEALILYANDENPAMIRGELPDGVVNFSETQHVWYDRGAGQPTGLCSGYGKDVDGDGLTDLTGVDSEFGIVGYIPGFIPPWDDPTYW